jgi:hypothetical protein
MARYYTKYFEYIVQINSYSISIWYHHYSNLTDEKTQAQRCQTV